MVTTPALLVLDEPTSGVDPLARARLWDTIRSAAEEGLGVLVTTHHTSEAGQCDRLVVLAEGRVVASGTQEEIVGDATVVEVESSDWAAAFTALDRAGVASSLQGRTARVIDADEERVRSVLASARIEARLTRRPATQDEVIVRVASGSGAAAVTGAAVVRAA